MSGLRSMALRICSLLLGILPLAACNPPYPRGGITPAGPDQPPSPELRRYVVDGREIQYAIVEHSGSPRIVFIHGSPGDWQAFAAYLDAPGLREFGPQLAPDRPGYGGSEPGRIEPDLRAQAKLLAPLLQGAGAPAIIVGHSLGGPIALRMAIDYPQAVRGVLLIAGSVAPKLEAPRWYNRAARFRPVQWMLPDELVWSNRELYGLQQQVQQIEADWSRLRAPVYVVQGMKDKLVDPRSADYLESQLAGHPHRIWRIEDQGHFVLWKEPKIIIDALRELIAASAPKSAALNDQPYTSCAGILGLPHCAGSILFTPG